MLMRKHKCVECWYNKKEEVSGILKITLRYFTVLGVVRGFACNLFINRTSNYGLDVSTYY